MYYLAIIMTFISINIQANDHVTSYSDSFSFRSHLSKKINVYGKGYRYQNRIFYREKLNSKKLCEKSITYYRSRTNSTDLSLDVAFADLSVRVGVGRLSSVQFACDLEVRTISGAKDIQIDTYSYSFEDLMSAQSFCSTKLSELQSQSMMVSSSTYERGDNFICEVSSANNRN